MDILVAGVTIGAALFVALFFLATAGTIFAFLQAQTMLLKAVFTNFSAPHAHLHPFTQQLLNGESPELKLAQSALAKGDRAEARRITEEIIFMLNAETNSSMRKQLQRKLERAVK